MLHTQQPTRIVNINGNAERNNSTHKNETLTESFQFMKLINYNLTYH